MMNKNIEKTERQPIKKSRVYRVARRCMDLLGSIIGLILLSPVFLVTIIMIAIEDGRPFIYKQKRVGKHKKVFYIYKFRSMRKDAEAVHEEMKKQYDMRRRYLVKAFNDMGLDCFTPEGAFYVFPCIKSTGLSSEEFCEKLLHSKKVAVVPGGAFGSSGEGFVRVSYAYSLDHIMEAAKRIKEFIEELEK